MFAIQRTPCKLLTIFKYVRRNYVTLQRKERFQTPNIASKLQIIRLQSRPAEVVSLSDDEIQEITQGDTEQQHKLQVLLLETEILRQEGKLVPSSQAINLDNWRELLSKNSRSGRRKYLEFLFKMERKKVNREAKKEERKKLIQERPQIEPTGPLRYDLGYNNMFLRIYDGAINNFLNGRLMHAMQFSQKIVVDCGYHEHMIKKEIVNCAKQLMMVFAENRSHIDPFDVHFCNVDPTAQLEHYLHKFIPTMYDAAFPMNIHTCSYLDIFPKQDLVYLTPHCREELQEYNHDAVYIIGGIVDKVNNAPLSLAKAKREGIPMAKLPLDKYLTWGCGSGKSLTLNQVMAIMLDMRFKNDWKYALRHVPRRKLVNDSTEIQEGHVLQPSVARYENKIRFQEKRWRSKNINYGSEVKPVVEEHTRSKRLLHLENIMKE